MSAARTYKDGLSDLIAGARNWRMAHLLGFSVLRQRYARSRLGQFWVSITTGVITFAFALVWSLLWGIPIAEYLPYIAIAHIGWGMITASLQDATTAISANAALFQNQETAFSVPIYGLVWRQLIILAHNFAVIFLVWLLFPVPLNWDLLLFVPGLVLVTISCVLGGYLIAIFAARFRDIIQVVNNILQVLYLLTPVMWYPEWIPAQHDYVLKLNPLAAYLSVIRDPLLGREIPLHNWLIAGGITAALIVLTPLIIGRVRKKLVFWV